MGNQPPRRHMGDVMGQKLANGADGEHPKQEQGKACNDIHHFWQFTGFHYRDYSFYDIRLIQIDARHGEQRESGNNEVFIPRLRHFE